MKKLIILLIVGFTLIGCSKSSTSTNSGEQNNNGNVGKEDEYVEVTKTETKLACAVDLGMEKGVKVDYLADDIVAFPLAGNEGTLDYIAIGCKLASVNIAYGKKTENGFELIEQPDADHTDIYIYDPSFETVEYIVKLKK